MNDEEPGVTFSHYNMDGPLDWSIKETADGRIFYNIDGKAVEQKDLEMGREKECTLLLTPNDLNSRCVRPTNHSGPHVSGVGGVQQQNIINRLHTEASDNRDEIDKLTRDIGFLRGVSAGYVEKIDHLERFIESQKPQGHMCPECCTVNSVPRVELDRARLSLKRARKVIDLLMESEK